MCVCVCDVFSFTITWSSGTVRASPSYIVYYILQNVATVHLTRSRGENVELSVSSDSMRSFKYVPGFWRSLYNEGLKPIESRRVQFSTLHGFGKIVPCLLYVHFFIDWLWRSEFIEIILVSIATHNWNCLSVGDTSIHNYGTDPLCHRG